MFESQEPLTNGQDGSTVKPSLGSTVSYVTLAQAVGVKVDTLHGWVRQGKIPSPVYYGKNAGWPEDVARQIIAEGTKPAGTYPVRDSYQSRSGRAAHAPPIPWPEPKRKPKAAPKRAAKKIKSKPQKKGRMP